MIGASKSSTIQMRNLWTEEMKNFKNAIVHVSCVLGLSAGLGLAGGHIESAHAQDNSLKKYSVAKKKLPLLLQADKVSYDNRKNRVVAKGNVEIYYNKHALFADMVVYDQRNNTLSAIGNVRIKEPGGSMVYTDRTTLTDDFREGFIQSLKIVTKDNARIAAARARRVDGDTTVFERGAFTTCKACKKTGNVLWRIKAGTITHKQKEKNIYYEDATLEFLGIPVAYIPYFSHPDPTVKRRSGFLFPKISHSTELGFTFELPYFYNIAPNKDLTFSPKVTSEQGILWQGEWRHRTDTGAYSIKLDGIREENPSLSNRYRGSVKTTGAFKADENWTWGWDITAESDDTYRRKYGIDNILTTNRVSKVYAIRQTERNWLEANMYHFGALTSLDGSNAEAFVHPSVDYNHVFSDPVLGGELSFDANVLSLSRNEGTDTNRVVARVKWRRTMIDSLGQVYEPFFQVRGDAYHVTNVDGGLGVTPNGENYVTRGQAVAGITYSFPFVARSERASHIVEPIVQLVSRTNGGYQDQLPNEDARSLVFDDTILFDANKFSGYDRMDDGTRVNIGARYTMQMHSGGHVKAVVGQSIHVAGDNPYGQGTGLDTTRSDYVAAVYLEPSANFLLLSQARFDEKTFDIKRTDIFMKASYGPLNGSVNYANIDAAGASDIGFTEDREEVQATASLQVSNYWSVFGSLRYDLADESFIQDAVGIKYADECFVLSVSYNETFISDGDIQPDNKVMVRFELKQLGGTSIETDISDNLISGTNEQ